MKRILAIALALCMLFSMIPAVAAADSVTADVFDVDFSTRSNADRSATGLTPTNRGNVSYVWDETLQKHVALFDGSSAITYPFSEQWSRLSGGLTFEATFRYISLPDTKEHDILSNQQAGGFGLGINNGNWTFFLKAGGSWREARATASDITQWHHMVGVWDGSSTKLYLDGQLVGTTASSGALNTPDSRATELVIGGDSGYTGEISALSNACVASARVYSTALTAEQVSELAAAELTPTGNMAPEISVAAYASVVEAGGKWHFPKTTLADDGEVSGTASMTAPDGTLTELGADALNGLAQFTLDQTGKYVFTVTATDATGLVTTTELTVMALDPEAVAPIPAADVLDVDFADGTPRDKSPMGNSVTILGSPSIKHSEELGKNVAMFNGEYDAFLFPFGDEQYQKMTAAFTMESVFCYDSITDGEEEDVFSNQQSGGIGFGVENGELTFFCYIDGKGYVELKGAIEANKWYHVVGCFDGTTVKLYVNGQLVDEESAGGTAVKFTTTAAARNMVIGGDSGSGTAENYAPANVSLARLYGTALSDEQVALRYLQMDPVLIVMSGDAGSINLNEECVVSTAIASNGAAASVTVTDPDGQPVDISGGTFVPDRLGDYTFTYVLEDTGMTRVIVRSCVDPQNPPVTIGLIGADQAASGHRFNVVIHMNRDDQAVVGDSAFTLTYDPAVVSYRGADLKLSTVSVTDDGAGKLAITYTGDVTTDDFMKYDTTRLVKLVFESEAAETDRDAVFTVENIQIDTETNRIIAEPKTVKVVGQSSLDRNGDGVIGAGDIALAETMAQKQLIAAEAAIYPYKHAVVITIDGGGICFRPDRMYYASSASVSPTLTDDPSILALRHNPYAMSLFNEYCATSYSALSETPTSSTPNYTSILHGKEYATARPSHQIVNSKAAIYYYPDFVEEVPLYPSVFKALGKTFPNRGTAATAEWKEIVSGVIEPDAPVYTFSYGYSAGSMQDVADYILSEDWNNTAMIYLQSDEMDHVGHASGYFTPKFYSSLTQYDGYLKAVMDALEAVGSKDDTLLVINTDHGGNKKSHSGPTDPEYDVLIALGGQTIHSGKLLEGGENHDIPAIVLTALRSEIPESMDGTADLLQQASLNQTELIAKNRNVETVTATTGTDCNALLLTLSNVQEGNTITVLDTVVDLKGQELLALETEGAVLRQETADGKLYLTISYAQTPETLALLNLSGETCEAQVEEFMLGTASGKEIYGDLALTTGELLNQSPYAQAKAVDAMIEAIDPADRATVLAARAAYDALSDEAKAHVTKLAELKAAESTWDPEKEIASLVLTGPDVVHAYDGAVTYTLCAENMHALATVHLEIDVPTAYLAEPVAQAADGWYIVVQVLKGDKLTVVAANNDGANGDGDILTLTVKPVKKAGEAVLAVSFAELGAYLGEEETFVSTDLTGAALTVQVRYNVCDVNHDGVVNLLDMTRAQRWYDTDNADADVNSSGDVDIIDLILILNNYNEKFAE